MIRTVEPGAGGNPCTTYLATAVPTGKH